VWFRAASTSRITGAPFFVDPPTLDLKFTTAILPIINKMPRSSKTGIPTLTFLQAFLLGTITAACNSAPRRPPTRKELFSILHDRFGIVGSEAHLAKLLLELQHWKPPLVVATPDTYNPYPKHRVPLIYMPSPSIAQDPLTARVALHVFHRTQVDPLPITHLVLSRLMEQINDVPLSTIDAHIQTALACGYIRVAPIHWPIQRPFPAYHASDKTRAELLYLLTLGVVNLDLAGGDFEGSFPPTPITPELLLNIEKELREDVEKLRLLGTEPEPSPDQ
jgi:hypothetical protein